MLLALAALAAADTVTLRYAPDAPMPAAMKCVGDREAHIGETGTKHHLELRVTPEVRKLGDLRAIGTGRTEVLAVTTEPPPPAGPNLERLLPHLEALIPDMLVDAQGRWAGVEPIAPEAQDAALTALFTEAGLPPELVTRLKAGMLAGMGPEAVAGRLQESWYASTGHWLDRTLEIGRSEIGTTGPGEPVAEGTQLTWSATRRLPCGGKGPAECVELRLESKPPPEAMTHQAGQLLGGVTKAMGVTGVDVTYEHFSLTTTWTEVVDPRTLAVWSNQRAKVVDASAKVKGTAVSVRTSDVYTCTPE